MKKYVVWVIVGYDEKLSDAQGTLTNSIEFQLIAKTYKEAMDRAKLLYPKKAYYLKVIIEKLKNEK